MATLFDLEIPTVNSRSLGAVCYEPSGSPVGQVVIHGATAVLQRYYAPFARHLAASGLRVLTYDYRGIGRSRDRSLRRDPVTMADWIDDASAAQTWLHARAPQLPLTSVGHSFGGQIATALDAGRCADAVLLIAAQSGYYGTFPPSTRRRLWLTWKLALPALTRTFGYLPGWAGLAVDLPAGVARQWGRWCASPDYLLSELPDLAPRLAAYDGPLLALSFADDDFAPLTNVRWMLERISSARIDHRHVSPADIGLEQVGHFGFFRPAAEQVLWPVAVDFLRRAGIGYRDDMVPRPGLSMRDVMADLEYGRA